MGCHLPLKPSPVRALRLPAQAEVHVICAHGRRSLAAARLLRRAGFTTVYSVRGGTVGWQRAGLPLDR
ncbi:MAG TPA: rhodanese-like domain-containing protein [Clostridia bacterium]|nr:rhodanese-like domain-containing protein [Clostridia bacterium]